MKHLRRPEWWTDEISDTIKKRDSVNKKDCPEEYKLFRNRATKLVRQEKAGHYRALLSRGQAAVKDFWKHLRELVPKGASSSPNEIEFNDNIADNPLDIANGLNNWFTSIVSKYISEDNCDNSNTMDKLVQYVQSKGDAIFSIPLVSDEFVEKFLRDLDKNKTAGLDGIQAYFLSVSAEAIAPSLTSVLNKFIRAGKFPSMWKQARVAPLHKGGSTRDPGNYRPISVLPILSKLLERHIYNHLMNFLIVNDLLYGNQSGFRSFHSCQTALTRLVDCWSKNIQDGELVGVIFLDLRKAFDLVNHDTLLQKLEIYGIRDTEGDELGCSLGLSLFRDYLSGRSQLVNFSGVESEKVPVEVGVPQGSILGPLLFLLYINDLPLHIFESTVEMFADDSTFHTAAKTLPTLEKRLNSDLVNVNNWCEENRMCPNAEKTKCMLLTTCQKRKSLKNDQLELVLGNSSLQNVESDKLLGVIIHKNLSWSPHVDSVCKKIKSKLYLLQRIRKYLPRSARRQFFNSFILPHFDYCLSVWGSCEEPLYMRRLDRLMKKGMRLILNCPFDTPSNFMYQKMKWFPLKYRYKHKVVQLVYKGLHGIAPPYINELLKYFKPNTTMTLRSVSRKNLEVPRAGKKVYNQSFSVIGPKLYNQLPSHVRDSKSFTAFKTISHSHFYQSYLDTM